MPNNEPDLFELIKLHSLSAAEKLELASRGLYLNHLKDDADRQVRIIARMTLNSVMDSLMREAKKKEEVVALINTLKSHTDDPVFSVRMQAKAKLSALKASGVLEQYGLE